MDSKRSKPRCMKTNPAFYISVLLLSLISSCTKEKSCPGFLVTNRTEFCYTNPDTITFENKDSELFQVFISGSNESLPYTFECRDLYNVCPCINYIEAVATDSKTTTPYVFLRLEQSDVSNMQYFKYNVLGFEFEFDFINELPNINQMEHLKYYASYTINNVTFTDVIEITNLDLSTADIYKVYFNKQEGILRIIERKSNAVWSITN
jgi:hypothetical protein